MKNDSAKIQTISVNSNHNYFYPSAGDSLSTLSRVFAITQRGLLIQSCNASKSHRNAPILRVSTIIALSIVSTLILGVTPSFCAPTESQDNKTPKTAQTTGRGVDINRLADSIYIAEGGNKTRHPYGILTHYKYTTPRQACINTIKHALKDYDGKRDFISFLGSRYCPIGAKNDPKGLNVNWVKNVSYHYQKGGSK